MQHQPRVIIIGLLDRTKDLQSQTSSLKEAELLVATYGGEVVEVITQNASHRDSQTYIGSGKATQLNDLVSTKAIDILVVNDQLKSGQLYTLKNIISPDGSCEVWDRTQLILKIFEQHAFTAEAKLQIQLAQLHHHGPELSGLGLSLSQQAGGIGTRGIGETNTEIMHRHWQKEIRTIEAKLEKVTQNRRQQMHHRKQTGIPTVSIVGYTNAGKTTLFNALSSKEDKVQNTLFSTLNSSVSSLYLTNLGQTVFISDTIGFIQDLPTTLIDAFNSTLMETVGADVLLHVIDSSDENIQLKINTVNQILKDINLDTKPQIYVFNKADLLSKSGQNTLSNQFSDVKHLFVSANNNQGISQLLGLIETELIRLGMKRAKHLSYLDNL